MCWLKRRSRKLPIYKMQETPPAAPISENAVAIIWSENKNRFGEIFYENGIYKYRCWQLLFDDDFIGYYWSPMESGLTSFFDTLDKAKQEAEDLIKNK